MASRDLFPGTTGSGADDPKYYCPGVAIPVRNMNRPVIVCIGISHRDAELGLLWLRWVRHLCQVHPNGDAHLLVVLTQRAAKLNAIHQPADDWDCMFRTRVEVCPDELENGYPISASHLFLRTLEIAEQKSPRHAVLWCEADSWPMRPSWFAEIAAEYQTCGKPFLGVNVGQKVRQLSGVAVYPANWRELAPRIATVLEAPDYKLWGKGKGQPWDVWARDQMAPQMAESKLMTSVWKHRDPRPTRLCEISATTCLFHQDKTGHLVRELAATRYPEFMATLTQGRRFFFMNGHASRLSAKGLNIKFSHSKFSAGFHRSAVCSDELQEADAGALAALVGQLGIREINEEEFLKITGRQAKSLPEPRLRTMPVAERAVTHGVVYVMLGRYGDIANCLPFIKADADAGRRPTLVVSKDFADILDGVSYCDRIVWDGAYDQLPEALRWLRRDKGITAPVVAQYHRNPYDKARLTSSYQKEVWRLAGKLDAFDMRGPLVFDRRDKKREHELVWSIAGEWDDNREVIAIALESASSPLGNNLKDAIYGELQRRFKKQRLVDLSAIRAEKIFDMLAVLEMASVILTVDTSILHLARCVNRPIVALVNNGWRGSVATHVTETIRYEDVRAERVLVAVESAFAGDGIPREAREMANIVVNTMADAVKKAWIPRVFHVVDTFGSDRRHHVAQSTWNAAYAEGMVPVHTNNYGRDAATELGHPKALPFLKDILQAGINESTNDDDVIVWSNSDVGFAKGVVQGVGAHVRQHGAASMRRVESNGEGHMGRDLFAFTVRWLRDHWAEMPDYVIGVPIFDLGLVAMIRRHHGITEPLTTKNVGADMPPADMPPGFALHESHTSEWLERNHHTKPATRHNREAFWNWAQEFAPATAFSKGHNLL